MDNQQISEIFTHLPEVADELCIINSLKTEAINHDPAHTFMNAGTTWLLYVALEPYVRRFAPGILISWTRVLGGQFVDSRVGRDVLVGATVGVCIACFGLAFWSVPELLGKPPGTPRTGYLQLLLGASDASNKLYFL